MRRYQRRSERPPLRPTAARFLRPLALAAAGLALLAAGLPRARSMPILMDDYDALPESNPDYRGQCVICHVNANGAGALTPFGDKYERADLEFTPELMHEYGNLFLVDGAAPSPDAAKGGTAEVRVPGNEPFNARAYYRDECQKCHGRYGDGDPFQGVPAFATKKWIAERSEKTDELLHIILYGKDKMIGQAGKITEDEARELLEGIRTIAHKYSE